MKASGFIAGRIRFKGGLAATAIALSFFIIIIAVAISAGFRYEIRKGVQDISGDIMLTAPSFNYFSEDDPIDAKPPYLGLIASLPEVESVSPAIYRAGIIKNGDEIHGVVFKGSGMYADSTVLGAGIPGALARKMGLDVGDSMLCYFVGEKVKARRFTVTDIYPGILDSDDKLIVHARAEDLRRLNGWNDGQASAIEVRLKGKNLKDKDIREMSKLIGSIAYEEAEEDGDVLLATAATDSYAQLFDWLGLIDFNVIAILFLMTIVAGFNMISGLLILLFRNISTIGTLKTLGMNDRDVSGVFMRVSARLVLMGMAAGNALALLFCFLQDRLHLIKLNPDNYFVSFVPVSVNPLHIIAADLVAAVAIMLILSLGSLFISKIDPSETVKTE